MREQRFLGDLLVRRGLVPPERLEPLYAIQRERGVDLVDLLVNAQVVDRRHDRAGARRRGAAAVRRVASTRSTIADRARDAHCPSPSPRATSVLVVGRGRRRTSHVLVRRSVRHRRRSTTCASLFGKPVECDASRPREKVVDAINRVYEREAGGGELETEAGEVARGRGRRRHPRLRRRRADHPLGQLALLPGGEGARERHPHRAGGEGGHRPLPHRRRALRRAARAAQRS